MRTVTHIVPLVPPAIDGMGDYAINLARRLRDAHDWNSRFVVCDPDWDGGDRVEDFEIVHVPNYNSEALAREVAGAGTALLHYVGYGYHPRGIPFWLARGVLGGMQGRTRLVTVFHEIWAKGAPWRSAFYLSLAQKRLVRQFLTGSSVAFTSVWSALRKLQKLAPGRPNWLPVPSNLSVQSWVGPRERAEPPWRPLIFGQTWTRTPTVRLHGPMLRELHRRGLLDMALVAGKGARGFPAPSEDVALLTKFIPNEKIRTVGLVPPSASEIFTLSDFYLSSHPARDACKSGALMAAFAAGCPVILADGRAADPLVVGKHFLVCRDRPEEIEALVTRARAGAFTQIAQTSREWCRKYADWPVISREIVKGLEKCPA
jgi:hypothetical protein